MTVPDAAPDAANVIALIPAAGHGTRFPGSGSKEIHPLGSRGAGQPPVRLIDCLLNHLHAGGIRRAICIVREDKKDVPQVLGDGRRYGIAVDYCLTPPTEGAPFSLDAAWPSTRDACCLLGFPDIVFTGTDTVRRLLGALADTHADIALGLLPTLDSSRVDVVEMRGEDVRGLVIKPSAPMHEAVTWVMAAWRPRFTAYMHACLTDPDWCAERRRLCARRELHVGDLIQAAIETGMHVKGVLLGSEPSVDAGTPEGLRQVRVLLGFD